MKQSSLILMGLAGIAAFCGARFFYWQHRAVVLPGIVSSSPVATHEAHYPLMFIQKLERDPTAPQQIYEAYCMACHGEVPQIAVHAPRRGHPEEWARYTTWRDEALFVAASSGFNAMPARGGCFECSDALLRATIHYMYYNSLNHTNPKTNIVSTPVKTVHKVK